LNLTSHKIFIDQFTPIAYYEKLRYFFKGEIIQLFESAVNNDEGNFSYIIIGARERLWHEDNKSYFQDEAGVKKEVDYNPLTYLQASYKKLNSKAYREFAQENDVGFVDGFIGYIGYDMVKAFEPKLRPAMEQLDDVTKAPDLDLMRPKLIIAFSHKKSILTLISEVKSMQDKFSDIEKLLKCSFASSPLIPAKPLGEAKFTFSKEQFFEKVDNGKEMIRSGDVFQLLISNRLIQPAKVDRFSFYRILRTKNPSPYLFLLEYDKFAIAGSSPEVMVRLSDGQILLRPIAGTRRRGNTRARDKAYEEEMLGDAKEVAEHIMLVDLGRNDVGRVAKPGTVKVEALKRVERYSHVMHMVSDVVAEIDENKDMFDLFMATFTAGTMTGTPKVRAMELIAEYEGAKRGFYSGCVGYFGFDGNMDSSITIRTSFIEEDRIIFHAGAGVVADSQPELEYLEVNNKLAANRASYADLVALGEKQESQN
jgi:anthranilate synthase component I